MFKLRQHNDSQSVNANNMMFGVAPANMMACPLEISNIWTVTFQKSNTGCFFLLFLRLHFCLHVSLFTAFFLVDVQDSVAARAGVVGVLEVFHEEGDQAAAQD